MIIGPRKIVDFATEDGVKGISSCEARSNGSSRSTASLRSNRFGLSLKPDVERVCGSERFSESAGQWVEQGLENGLMMRDDRWSELIALGNREFVENARDELGAKALHRDVIEADGVYTLREQAEAYGLSFVTQSEALRAKNTFFWNETVD